MTCRKVVKELPAYLASELPEKTRSRVEAHLKHCALCTAELRALEQTGHLLDTLQPIEPRRDLVGAVVQHIQREQANISPFKRFLVSLRERQPQLQHAAAVLLLVAALGLMMYRASTRRVAIIMPKPPTPELAGMYNPVSPGAPDEIAKVDNPDEWTMVVPLGESELAQLNAGMHRAEAGEDEPALEPTPDSNIRKVGAVVIKLAPDGSLRIEPRQGGQAPVIADPGGSGESPAAE